SPIILLPAPVVRFTFEPPSNVVTPDPRMLPFVHIKLAVLVTCIEPAPSIKLPEKVIDPFTVRSVPAPSAICSVPLLTISAPPASTTVWSVSTVEFTVTVCDTRMVITPSVETGADGAATQAVPLYRSQMLTVVQLPDVA